MSGMTRLAGACPLDGGVGRHHSDERNHALRHPMIKAGASIVVAQATMISHASHTGGSAPNTASKTVSPLRSSNVGMRWATTTAAAQTLIHENISLPHTNRRQRPTQAATRTIASQTELSGSCCCASFQSVHTAMLARSAMAAFRTTATECGMFMAPNVRHERRLEASEACWKASARWRG